jgi:Flp pilus assembly protein TadD
VRHFAEAERLSQKHTELSRANLARYLADAPDPDAVNARAPTDTAFPLAAMPQAERAVLRRQATTELARACFNLGVMHARAGRPARAAEFLQTAADLDPTFPQVQYSLGSAYFNAQRYDRATAPLAQAFTANPADPGVRRMLALAWLNSGAPDQAAELLRNDPGRESDASLQLAYGLALLRGNRSNDAQLVFSALIARHGETPELNVVMGQAQAQERDFEAAEKLLRRAIELKANVPEAHAALGVIYLKQGKLPEAAAALRREMAINPSDAAVRHNLATVLELQDQRDEAVALLRGVLKERPDYADARYLLGKILLAAGATGEATEHLEAAVRIAPQDANIHYQLGLAYQKLGRAELATREFDTFRALKDKLAGRAP